MKGLYRYISPAAPDQSGAVSVLFELGGIIVVLDAGGCKGNICGFDEPRWFLRKSAVYSAGIRDMDAILGRDDRLIDKLSGAVETVEDARFIALIGTPLPSVIGTDYRALCRIASKRYGLPVIYVDTSGIDSYEKGASRACLALTDLLESTDAGHAEKGAVYVWGATPLDLPAEDSAVLLRRRVADREGIPEERVITVGMDSTLDELNGIFRARKNIVCAPSGLAAAKRLEKMYGIPAEVYFPVPEEAVHLADGIPPGTRVAVLHQQALASALRRKLMERRPDLQITVASFFTMDAELTDRETAEGGGLGLPEDVRISGEDEFIRFIRDNDFGAVMADPVYFRALKGMDIIKIPLPHYAVSGSMYRPESDAAFWDMRLRRNI